MADQKITQLTELDATPDDADILPIVDDVAGTPVTKKITVANLLAGAGGSASPMVRLSTAFETIARFNIITTGDGTAPFGGPQARVITNATATSGAIIFLQTGAGSNGNLRLGSPTIYVSAHFVTIGTDFNWRFCSSAYPSGTGGALTFTLDNFGFKAIRASSGATNLYATQADGTTETASASLTTIVAGDALELIAKVDGTSSVDYYWSKNGSVFSSATNLSTNMPIGTHIGLRVEASNVGVATITQVNSFLMGYEK